MNEYTYENVKEAYKAIIEVGRANMIGLFGPMSAQVKHRQNLKQLEGASKELYERLLNDESINY